jgi:SulP family sulfate permease
LGWFKLGSLIRYIPYPVVGGFLAGTGWLLVSGALSLLAGAPLSLGQLPGLLQTSIVLHWFAALVFAVLLLLILRRHNHFLVVPAMILGAVVVFYLVLRVTGTSLAGATARGWLLGPFPEGALWQPLTPADLLGIYWPAVASQAGTIATVVLVSVVALLLNTSGLELTVRRDIDLNRELRSAGVGNLLVGLGSGPPGFQTLGQSALGHRLGADSRLVGVVTVVLVGLVLVLGARVVALFPKVVLAGLLLYLGLTFLVEWLYDAWFKLSRAEYTIVVSILIVIMFVGVLQGVGLGLALAVVLFVVSYSRISVVKHELSGSSYRSNVDRPWADRQTLRRRGDWIYILELQGFVFFGTASILLDQIRNRIERPNLAAPRYIVLDCRRVSGLDGSAVMSFVRMGQLAQSREFVLVFTHLSDAIEGQLAAEIPFGGEMSWCRIDTDLDHGIEWCEDQILAQAQVEEQAPEARSSSERAGAGCAAAGGISSSSFAGAALPEHAVLASGVAFGQTGLGEFLEHREVPAETYLIRQGETVEGLFLIESGQVTAQRDGQDGSMVRLRKMGPGSIVGEMGLYQGMPASASVVTDLRSTVFYLTADELARMERTRPAMAVAFHRYIAQITSERLSRANDTLQALLQ